MGKDLVGGEGDGGHRWALRGVENARPPSNGVRPEARVEVFLRGNESAFAKERHRGKVLAAFAAVTLLLASIGLLFPRGGPVDLRGRILHTSTTEELVRCRHWVESRQEEEKERLSALIELRRFVLYVGAGQLHRIEHGLVLNRARLLLQADPEGLGILLKQLTGPGIRLSFISAEPRDQTRKLLETLKDLQQEADGEEALQHRVDSLQDLRKRIFIAFLALSSERKTSMETLRELRDRARGVPLLEGLADVAHDPWAFLDTLTREYWSDASLGRLTVWPEITVGQVLERGFLREKLDDLDEDKEALEAVKEFLDGGSIPEQIKALGDLEKLIRGRTELVNWYRVRLARCIARAAIPSAFAPNEKAYGDARAWWAAHEDELTQVARETRIEGFEQAAGNVALAFKRATTFTGEMQGIAGRIVDTLKWALANKGDEDASWQNLRQELAQARPSSDDDQLALEKARAVLDLASGPTMRIIRWTREPGTASEGSIRAAKLELVRWLARQLHANVPAERKWLRDEDVIFDCKALRCSITFGYNQEEDVKKVGKGVKNADWTQVGRLAATGLLQQIGSAIWLAHVQCQTDRSALDTGWFRAPSLKDVPIGALHDPKEIAACTLLDEMPLLLEPESQATWVKHREERADSLPIIVRKLANRCEVVEHDAFIRRFGVSPLYHEAIFGSIDDFRKRAPAEIDRGKAYLTPRLDRLARQCFGEDVGLLEIDGVRDLFQLSRAEAFLRRCIQNEWYPVQQGQPVVPHDLRGEEWEAVVRNLVPKRLVARRFFRITDPTELLGRLGPVAEALPDEDVLDDGTLSFRQLAQLVLAERAYLGWHYDQNLGDKGPFGFRSVNERYEHVWHRNKKPFSDVFPGLPGLP